MGFSNNNSRQQEEEASFQTTSLNEEKKRDRDLPEISFESLPLLGGESATKEEIGIVSSDSTEEQSSGMIKINAHQVRASSKSRLEDAADDAERRAGQSEIAESERATSNGRKKEDEEEEQGGLNDEKNLQGNCAQVVTELVAFSDSTLSDNNNNNTNNNNDDDDDDDDDEGEMAAQHSLDSIMISNDESSLESPESKENAICSLMMEEVTENPSGEEEGEFCGESASNSTLRRLKMDAYEDALVCEHNRESMNAARRLFDNLARRNETLKKEQLMKKEEKLKTFKKGGSLGSANEPEVDSSDNEEVRRKGVVADGYAHGSSSDDTSSSSSSSSSSCDDIKIVRRSGSSASSTNFRQTLVCSVSPTSQLKSPTFSADMMTSETQLYPIDGDEILHCRAAFRENKRLIQQRQERSMKREGEQVVSSTGGSSNNNGNSCSPWTAKLEKRDLLNQRTQSTCSHCKQRLYPVDRMELDFTRTTLNIHRNCFKCQVCSALLRLETYAAMDAKLYCPAHTKAKSLAR